MGSTLRKVNTTIFMDFFFFGGGGRRVVVVVVMNQKKKKITNWQQTDEIHIKTKHKRN